MADNHLTVTFAGDASKLIAESERAKLEIRSLRKEASAAFQRGDTTAVAGYTAQIGKLQTTVIGANRAMKETGAVVESAGRSMAISARSVRSLNSALFGVGRSLGGVQGAIVGLGVAMGARGIGQAITGVTDGLNKLNQTAANTSFPAADIKAFQDIMAKSGVGADAAAGALGTFAKSVFEAQLKAGMFNKENNLGINVMKGAEGSAIGLSTAVQTMRGSLTDGAAAGQKFVNVWRGGQDNKIKDLSDSFELLRINVKAFPTTPVGLMALRIETARALQDTSRLNQQLRSQIGQKEFGPDWQAITAGLVQYANSPEWAKAQAQAEALFTPEAKQRLADYNTAWGTLQTTMTNGLQQLTLKYFPQLNAAIAAAPPLIVSFFSEMDKSIATTKQEIQGLIYLWNYLANLPGKIGSAVGTALSRVGEIPVVPTFADGGIVRGPGTATSDSVPARLSAGEFVMRAAAVERWGPSFMAALNGMGSRMPSRGVPHFADGGMVMAGAGGTPVHLHLGGHSFALSGAGGVVDALVTEAHRHKIRSAGTKPSWYGGAHGR